MGTQPARYSSVRQRVARMGCIGGQFFTPTPPNMAEPLMYSRLTPGMSALGCTLLLAKPPKTAAIEATAIQFGGILNSTPPNKLGTSITAQAPPLPARPKTISTPPNTAET